MPLCPPRFPEDLLTRQPSALGVAANVLRPDAAQLPLGYFIAHTAPLLQGLCCGVCCYASMVHEYRFASIVRMDEAVTTLTVKPTPDDPRFLA